MVQLIRRNLRKQCRINKMWEALKSKALNKPLYVCGKYTVEV